MICFLISEKHKITLVCFTREYNSPEHVKHMRQFCEKVMVFRRGKSWTIPNILRTGFSWYPFLVMIYFTPEIKEKYPDEDLQQLSENELQELLDYMDE